MIICFLKIHMRKSLIVKIQYLWQYLELNIETIHWNEINFKEGF